MEDKPKKTLSEAQRLAFLKGREKRMANIEKKKLEEEEKNQVTAIASPPPKPKIKRQPKIKPAEQVVPNPPSEPTEIPKSPPKPEVKSITPDGSPHKRAMSDGQIEEFVNKIMSKIDNQIGDGLVDKLINTLKAEAATKKTRKKKDPQTIPKAKKPKETLKAPPPAATNNFTWM